MSEEVEKLMGFNMICEYTTSKIYKLCLESIKLLQEYIVGSLFWGYKKLKGVMVHAWLLCN